jgi:tetratricopeptide (TPR) repeat protein
MMEGMDFRYARIRLSSLLSLLVFLSPCAAQVEIQIKQTDTAAGADPILIVASEASGSVPYSFTGLGAIRSGALVAGSSKTYTYTKAGVLQYKIGPGEIAERGMIPLKVGTATEVSLTGFFSGPPASASTAEVAAPEFQFQPAAEGSLSIQHPYGAAFEQLSVDQKIKLIEESPLTEQLAPGDAQKLLGLLYNEKGVQAANLNRFAEAETALLQSLKYMPSHSSVSTNLAFVIAAQGKAAMAAGESRKAETRFQEALNILEGSGDNDLTAQVRTALASVYVEEAQAISESNGPSAVSLFKRALEQDPGHVVALFELGKRAYAEYDLATALQYFEAAYRRAPQQDLADLIEKLKVEIEQAGEFVTEDRGDFKISFEGREVKSIAATVRKLLADAQQDVGRKSVCRRDIPVSFIAAVSFKELGLHSWAGSAYDRKIRSRFQIYPIKTCGSARPDSTAVFHEYPRSPPQPCAVDSDSIWFQEWRNWRRDQNPEAGLYHQMANGLAGSSASEMTGDFASVPTRKRILYLVSYSFIRFLLEDHGGWSRLRKAVDGLVSGESIDKAIDSAYREPLVDLENEWMAGL